MFFLLAAVLATPTPLPDDWCRNFNLTQSNAVYQTHCIELHGRDHDPPERNREPKETKERNSNPPGSE